MKRVWVLLSLLSLLVVPCCVADHAAQGQWVARPIASGSEELFAYFASLALDSDGIPHILYNDEDASLVKLAIWDGAAWQVSTLAQEPGYFCRLAFDGDAMLHGIYITAHGSLRYGTLDGVWTWQTVGEVGDGTYADLVLSSQGHPYIAHINAISGMLICNWYDGAAWHRDEIAQVGVDITNYRELGIAMDADDVPHISAPHEPGGAACSLLHATVGSEGWGYELVDTIGARGKSSDVLVDQQGIVHITYRDSDAHDLRHAWFDGTWHLDRVDARGDVGYHSSLATNRAGQVQVAYYDREADLQRFGWWADAAWQSETLSGISQCRDAFTSLVLDGRDQPHLLAVRAQGSRRELNYVYFDAVFYDVALPLILR